MGDEVVFDIEAGDTLLQICRWPKGHPLLAMMGPGNESVVLELTPDTIGKLTAALTKLKEQPNG